MYFVKRRNYHKKKTLGSRRQRIQQGKKVTQDDNSELVTSTWKTQKQQTIIKYRKNKCYKGKDNKPQDKHDRAMNNIYRQNYVNSEKNEFID